MTTLNLQVGQSSDDCYRKKSDTTFSLTDNNTWCGDSNDSAYDLCGGYRFSSVTIGQGDTIDAASMQFRATALSGSIPTTYIEGEDTDDAVTFTNYTNYDGRARTSAISWTPGAWVANNWYTTPELKTIIQTIVDRGGWAGDGLVTFWRDASGWGGTQKLLKGVSRDLSAIFCAKLDIDYTAAGVTTRRYGLTVLGVG